MNSMMERQLNQRFDHAMYGLKPEHRVDSQVGKNSSFIGVYSQITYLYALVFD